MLSFGRITDVFPMQAQPQGESDGLWIVVAALNEVASDISTA